jgi:hypothetical protein
MKARAAIFGFFISLLVTYSLFAAPRVAEAASPFKGIIVSGTTDGGGTFLGKLDVVDFEVIDGQLTAIGQLSGAVTGATGKKTDVKKTMIALPVSNAGPAGVAAVACDILHLQLGPLDLDLLGLVVHLNQVVLDITAQPGAGNLLGNLLCAIAGLLNSIDLAQLLNLANLLNLLLSLLG